MKDRFERINEILRNKRRNGCIIYRPTLLNLRDDTIISLFYKDDNIDVYDVNKAKAMTSSKMTLAFLKDQLHYAKDEDERALIEERIKEVSENAKANGEIYRDLEK